MPRLKGATASDQIVRKRKRKAKDDEQTPQAPSPEELAEDVNESTTTTTTVPTKTHDGGKKPRRTNAKNGRDIPPLERHGSSTLVETSIPWPEHFTSLARTHRALNLVYTFFCTRKHLATTFENLKSTVEGHIQRELLVKEVAQIAALLPTAIHFAYVDEAMLQINLMGSEDNVKGRKAQEFVIAEPTPSNNQEKEVLLFEYVDGDLKRQVQHAKTGEPTKAVQRLRNEDLKMPVFSQKQMMKLIEKRNTKFTSAVNLLLNQHARDGTDPVQGIETASLAFIPTPSESRPSTPRPERSMLPSTIPTERKAIPEIIEEIKTLEWYTGQIVPDGHRVFDPQAPIYGDLNFQLSQNMVNALFNTRNITQLYSHQAEAINSLHDGNNVIVSTSTSSGKSLIYQIPVLHQLEQDMNSRAMYIFPTKALAQDQRRSLKNLLHFMDGLQDVLVETFDGDTPMTERNYIRDEARIIFTNPDMLHITILPHEESWRTFLQNLRFVVVDELHVYNGLFGSHVAMIMRRLRRICAALGNRHVKFISCSATVANPEEHMKTIFGIESVSLTDVDGSPSGRKEFLCWNTPFKDPGDPTSGRGDSMRECAKLFCQLILRGVRVIAFCRIRKQCEVLFAAIKTELTGLEKTEAINRVMSYRGGYTPQDRRQIEKEMFDGKLVGIVATNALELGIDIGSLDAVVTCGFPYTIANLRQQSGRAGRRNKDSLSVLVGDCFPTDQHYMSNPDEIFTKPNCELQVDLENILCLEGHIQCAAYEMPINVEADSAYFGPSLPKIAKERMRKDKDGFFHCNERFLPFPSRYVAIRDTEDTHFAIIDITHCKNTVLEELEASRAFFTIYEGGIFLHQGNTYLVKEFSQERMIAKVEYVKVDWTTQQRDFTDIDPVETEAIRKIPGSQSRAFYGPIKIKQVVFGFFKVDKKRRILDAVHVDNPPIILFSKGMWIDVPKCALDILKSRRLNIAAAIHAAEHAVLSLMPNYVISMPGDVRTECKVALKEFAKRESQRKRPARLTFYDAKGGASGTCHCLEGCLECCCDERCKEANQVMSKAGALVVIMCILGRADEIDVEALPWGEDEAVPAGIETVVLAEEVRVVRGKKVDGVWIKDEADDEFGRSIQMFGAERTFIGVHR
ncbi:P-loop containing nucleoside triphosphate hydrolase protein [Polyplosphaeria fusca]|uniref:P-loop containing nucleoside triphosphate hydrolase protein n=1 Tax=Polyplosphaeria fusca TaxID=682080 RepID=A0A9P4QT09_9PLEO|nr:P-loop containing nucleoside triphosphate hydrolase protein [Polyplosphaeria fusca]